jgi:hypothetical protein
LNAKVRLKDTYTSLPKRKMEKNVTEISLAQSMLEVAKQNLDGARSAFAKR